MTTLTFNAATVNTDNPCWATGQYGNPAAMTNEGRAMTGDQRAALEDNSTLSNWLQPQSTGGIDSRTRCRKMASWMDASEVSVALFQEMTAPMLMDLQAAGLSAHSAGMHSDDPKNPNLHARDSVGAFFWPQRGNVQTILEGGSPLLTEREKGDPKPAFRSRFFVMDKSTGASVRIGVISGHFTGFWEGKTDGPLETEQGDKETNNVLADLDPWAEKNKLDAVILGGDFNQDPKEKNPGTLSRAERVQAAGFFMLPNIETEHKAGPDQPGRCLDYLGVKVINPRIERVDVQPGLRDGEGGDIKDTNSFSDHAARVARITFTFRDAVGGAAEAAS